MSVPTNSSHSLCSLIFGDQKESIFATLIFNIGEEFNKYMLIL